MEAIAIILAVVAILLTCCGKNDRELYIPDDIPMCANFTDYVDGILEGKQEIREEVVNRLMELKTRTKGTEYAMVVDILDTVRRI